MSLKQAVKARLRPLLGKRIDPLYGWSLALRRMPAIRRYDRSVGHHSALWPEGFKRYPKVSEELLVEARRFVGQPPFVVDESSVRLVRHVIATVRTDARAYLGPGLRLDNISISTVPSGRGLASVSGSWHDDAVGNRLKVFVCLEGHGDVPTAVVPGTNKQPYWPRFAEYMRFAGADDFGDRDAQVLIRHTTGDCVMFDTNALHRGVYDRDHHQRILCEFELVDRAKSNHFRGIIPIGPGNSGIPAFEIDKAVADRFADELLLDRTCLQAISPTRYRYACE